MAASASGSSSWMTHANATTMTAETCASARVKFDAAEKAHATSANLEKAKAEAKIAAVDCKSGKATNGIAAYDAATKLLTT